MSKRKASKQPNAKQVMERTIREYQDTSTQVDDVLNATNTIIDTYPKLVWGAVVDAELIEKTDSSFDQAVDLFHDQEKAIRQTQAETTELLDQYHAKKIHREDAHTGLLFKSLELSQSALNIPLQTLHDCLEVKTEYSVSAKDINIDALSETVERMSPTTSKNL